jgi:hypothetical protein
LRNLIDKAPKRGYVLLPLAAPHHRRDGPVFDRPSNRVKRSRAPPGGGRGNHRMSYERSAAASGRRDESDRAGGWRRGARDRATGGARPLRCARFCFQLKRQSDETRGSRSKRRPRPCPARVPRSRQRTSLRSRDWSRRSCWTSSDPQAMPIRIALPAKRQRGCLQSGESSANRGKSAARVSLVGQTGTVTYSARREGRMWSCSRRRDGPWQ